MEQGGRLQPQMGLGETPYGTVKGPRPPPTLPPLMSELELMSSQAFSSFLQITVRTRRPCLEPAIAPRVSGLAPPLVLAPPRPWPNPPLPLLCRQPTPAGAQSSAGQHGRELADLGQGSRYVRGRDEEAGVWGSGEGRGSGSVRTGARRC